MKQIHADRLMMLADLAQSDGQYFNYSDCRHCLFPRARAITNHDGFFFYRKFGLSFLETFTMFNVHQRRNHWSRDEVATHIRSFVASKGFKVTNARLIVETAIKEEVAIGHSQS